MGTNSGDMKTVRQRGIDVNSDDTTECLGYLIFNLGVILTEILEAVNEGVRIICWWVEIVSKMGNFGGSEEEFHSVTSAVSRCTAGNCHVHMALETA